MKLKTTTLILSAIIAALPFGVLAENISGAMYTAPAQYDNNHPAPTTNAYAPYGRINIDTDDQEHIATTAYVKGAYNSAIAAVNKVDSEKQGKLVNADGDEISNEVVSTTTEDIDFVVEGGVISVDGSFTDVYSAMSADIGNLDETLMTAGAILQLVHGASVGARGGAIDSAWDMINDKVVAVYTTWDDDTAKAPVDLSSIGDFE